MDRRPKTKTPRYFWRLDSKTPGEYLKGYREALADRSGSEVLKWVEIIERGVPVPPRAYLTSAFLKSTAQKLAPEFFVELDGIIERFETETRQRFSSGSRETQQPPLLLTLQSSFCGTIRNIGVSLDNLKAMSHFFGPITAYALYADFLESFSSLVLGCPHIDFRSMFQDKKLDDTKHRVFGAGRLADLSEIEFEEGVRRYMRTVSERIKRPFPESTEKQLLTCLLHFGKAAASSGGDEIFFVAQVQRQLGGQSTRGVVYSRHPFTGKNDVYGVYEMTEDGSKKGTIEPDGATDGTSVRERFPVVYEGIKRHLRDIESAFRRVVEAEFVSDEDGRVVFTNFDTAQTTARANVVSAVELALAGVITDAEAALRIKPADVDVLLHPTLDDESRKALEDLGSTGVAASPGTAVGRVFFRMADAMEFHKRAKRDGKDPRVILIQDELLISDTPGLGMIHGLVTTASGIASHAAVMARANGIPCLVGYKGLEFDSYGNAMTVNGRKIEKETVLTLEAGAEGRLYVGEGKLQSLSIREGLIHDVSELMGRVVKREGIRTEIRININNSKDAATGLAFGADGVGLCRTENMFMGVEAIREIRKIVFSEDVSKCQASLGKLEEIQFEDFRKIFEVMGGRVVNIRLMDLPLHDFAPKSEEDYQKLAKEFEDLDEERLRAIADGLTEHNPMLGLRACRYGLIHPEIYDMQVRAIIRAAYAVASTGVEVNPGIMFPLVFSEQELLRLKARVIELEKEIRRQQQEAGGVGDKVRIRVGCMIELPAAALNADALAKAGEFFAFGTNDLTQTTLGISRDDSAHYLPQYIEKGIIPSDPFQVLSAPVKELIETAVRRGLRVRADGSYGICGEQGADPATLDFIIEKGLHYISCSPFRILPARVSLVHAALKRLGERVLRAQNSDGAARAEMATSSGGPNPVSARTSGEER